jgi:hypothetical protein
LQLAPRASPASLESSARATPSWHSHSYLCASEFHSKAGCAISQELQLFCREITLRPEKKRTARNQQAVLVPQNPTRN